MKLIINALFIILIISFSGLTSCTSFNIKTPAPNPQSESMKNELIPLVLPPTAYLYLKKGNSKSGRLTEISLKQIKLEGGGSSATVTIANIQKIEFQGELVLYGSKKIVIRGDQTQTSFGIHQETWTEPIANFKLVNPNEGKATLKLTSVTDTDLKGIKSVAVDSSYVVEEMQFESPDKIRIKVTVH